MKAAHRISAILAVGALFCTVLVAQRNSAVPQPQAGRLPPSPLRGFGAPGKPDTTYGRRPAVVSSADALIPGTS